VANACPHMGFPLVRGTVEEGILTCHWHHARFDLETGGSFDLWADDVRSYPVEVRGTGIWVDLRPRVDRAEHQRRRLRDGLDHDLPLVLAKAALALLEHYPDPGKPSGRGWNLAPAIAPADGGQGLPSSPAW